MEGSTVRDRMLSAFRAAIEAADPFRATVDALAGERLPDRVAVVALGKASPAMARGAAHALGGRLAGGLVVCDRDEPVPEPLRLAVGSHPTPDASSVRAGGLVMEEATRTDVDLVLVLVSGGGSAMAEVPRAPASIRDVAEVADRLMSRGAPIEDLNTVRRHLSRTKNGGLLRVARVPVLTLLISDVAGAAATTVASGPTLHDGSTPAAAAAILARYGIDPSARIREALTPDADTRQTGVAHRWKTIADGETAARAAASVLDDAPILTTELHGEAAEAALGWIRLSPHGFAVLTGETTVAVSGDGLGGRNQHAALAVSNAIEGTGVSFAALGTDGRDGPTDAAGAIVDGRTAAAIRAAGVDPVRSLSRHDSHRALDAGRALVRTGPTGTNVGDLWMVHRP